MATSDNNNNNNSMERLQTFKDAHLALAPKNDFAGGLWDNVKITSASNDTNTAVFTALVPSEYGNHRQSAHGGAIATLFDSLTGCTLALISEPGYWVSRGGITLVSEPGYWDGREVTRNLQINYFRPVPVSEKIRIECEIVNAGKRLATVRGLMMRDSDGTLLASCLHDKFNPVAGGGSKL
ncbi:hypothetical protein TI39_contig4297g00007 [Zymoseptoria brevis]|uniref:Thioesterase domain-containing protein n=1 Tax=Zymoseptoria brevis TaxID=1047168 RepID=A0A0F4G829_9PEZI|nr:hypothetical protein TI39_contig4297g00007 [Zymoseptoria brevis]